MSDCAPKREVPILWPCDPDFVSTVETRPCPGPVPDKVLEAYPNNFPLPPQTVEHIDPPEVHGDEPPGPGPDVIHIPGILVEDGTYLSTQSLVFLIRQDA